MHYSVFADPGNSPKAPNLGQALGWHRLIFRVLQLHCKQKSSWETEVRKIPNWIRCFLWCFTWHWHFIYFHMAFDHQKISKVQLFHSKTHWFGLSRCVRPAGVQLLRVPKRCCWKPRALRWWKRPRPVASHGVVSIVRLSGTDSVDHWMKRIGWNETSWSEGSVWSVTGTSCERVWPWMIWWN